MPTLENKYTSTGIGFFFFFYNIVGMKGMFIKYDPV